MLVLFVAPYFTENAKRYLDYVTRHAQVLLITQDDPALLAPELRARIVRAERVSDALDKAQIVVAANELQRLEGPVAQLLGVVEQLQVPLAEARAELNLPGMRPNEALNFRDKTRMKELLRQAGLPVARFQLVDSTEAALRFAAEVGYPLVVKPPAGAASQATFFAQDEAVLRNALALASAEARGAVLLEELVTGQEHSFDAFVQGGQLKFYSVSNYLPSCLEVMRNPWMQWVVVLPREYESQDIAEAGAKALSVLGLHTGMCHLEWFRRANGELVISEVGARPPGAQFPTMISRAHDSDCLESWANLLVNGEWRPLPERRFAAGTAYLRGQGEGRVRAVHGLEAIEQELGALICDRRLPSLGQPKSPSYEGEGLIMVKHPETQVVEQALMHIVSNVRVELG
jgi:hypothetical protein